MPGIALGLFGSLLLRHLLQGLLHGVSTSNPMTLFGVPALMAVGALLACWLVSTVTGSFGVTAAGATVEQSEPLVDIIVLRTMVSAGI